MKRALLAFSFILIAIALLAACSTPGNQTVTLSDADAGKTITLHTGDTLVIHLDGNPTTGYNWDVSRVDVSVLQAQGDVQFTPDTSAIGSGGTVVLTFLAASTGQTTLQLAYHRSWVMDVAPLQTFTVTVVVK
jgi:inhibitor of cysteine peptidase